MAVQYVTDQNFGDVVSQPNKLVRTVPYVISGPKRVKQGIWR